LLQQSIDLELAVRNGFQVHRIVQDESHLFSKGGASAKLDAAILIKSKFRWGVTATPITTSIIDLEPQISFMDGKSTKQGRDLEDAMWNGTKSQDDFNLLIDRLVKVMIRHTKSQRINGNEALTLPPSTTSTVILTMSEDENRVFNQIHIGYEIFCKRVASGAQAFIAERCFAYPMGAILRRQSRHDGNRPNFLEHVAGSFDKYCYNPDRLTKILALRNDLRDLRQHEPELKAVVFTQFLEVHSACVRGLKKDGYDVYEFTGSSNSVKRDAAIRNFQQGTTNRPTVFVITIRSGNVGITLNAASRVYLLEPCLDPAVEVQAAGRIHRLGQDKPCRVIKFAFKNSYEANILKLHKEIVAGRMELVNGFVPPKAMKILAEDIYGAGVYE
jgi:SNF2 family DNA or RNA helicase